MKSALLVLVSAASLIVFAGCQSAKPVASAGFVNAKCPMMPEHPLSGPKVVSTQWNGQTVGFCCAGCIPEWNSLTDSQKAARLAAVK